MDTKKILESLTDMGCDEKEISFMKKMYEEGDTDTLLRDLRKCRCHLMDELHDSQKKVDNMDFLIRLHISAERNTVFSKTGMRISE